MLATRPNSRPFSNGSRWFSRRNKIASDLADLDSQQLLFPSATSTIAQTQVSRPQTALSMKKTWFSGLWQTWKNTKITTEDPCSQLLLDSATLDLLQVPVTQTVLDNHEERLLHRYLEETSQNPNNQTFYFPWLIWLRKDCNLSVTDTCWRQGQLDLTLANSMAANHSNVYVLRSLVKPTLKCHKIVFQVSPAYAQLFFSAFALVVSTGKLDPKEHVQSMSKSIRF